MKIETLHTHTAYSSFSFGQGISEYHVMIRITRPELTFEEQAAAIQESCRRLLKNELKGASIVFKRYFLSDAANQTQQLQAMTAGDDTGACSIVEQAPLDGSKIALWAYLLTDVTPEQLPSGLTAFSHNGYTHLWDGYRFHTEPSSKKQAEHLLTDYQKRLKEAGSTLAENCIRTWFFVQNVDVNYSGVVQARNEVFQKQNLTPETHFIASTGIEGRHADPNVCVLLDTYALSGIEPEQIHHLYARTHLNPTYEYGVSFERGTFIDYGDRRQTFISGTASINNQGKIVHPGDVRKQTLRMWENVEALLKEAEMDFSDMGQLIVYLRDIADYTVVKNMFEERFPDHPTVFVHAPVCRPGWLVEMECMGTKFISHPQFRHF